MGEWIKHNGRRRPVYRDAQVCVRMQGSNDGTPIEYVTTAENVDWVWRGGLGDIIAYRTVDDGRSHRSGM